jgi:hypothetical protein
MRRVLIGLVHPRFESVKANSEIVCLNGFHMDFEQPNKMTGFLGRQVAAIHRGRDSRHGCDDILCLFDRWQVEVDGATAPTRRQPLETVMQAANIALESELDQLAREGLSFVIEELLNQLRSFIFRPGWSPGISQLKWSAADFLRNNRLAALGDNLRL